MSVWTYVTNFGDSAVTLPLAAFVLLHLLLVARWRQGALAWAVTIGSCGLLVAMMKVGLRSCGGQELPTSPSGHTAMSVMVYGSLGILLAGRATGWRKASVLAPLLGLAMAVAVSRLVLGVHTPAEVLIGTVVGFGGVLAFARIAGPPPSRPRWDVLAAVTLAIVVAMHGYRWPVEEALRHLAMLVRQSTGCAA